MATTAFLTIHQNKGKSVAQTIKDRTDYAGNPDKTDSGELVTAYECDPYTVDADFLLAKHQYHTITSRQQGNDVLAYHIRQSFKPGEISPEDANRIGHELALGFTKGKHAFIVATHIDKAHIHNHVVFNSTTLDCERKFRDFLGTAKAVRRLSDRLCLENGLSIVENPKPTHKHYGKWLGNRKEPSARSVLTQGIDAVLAGKPKSYDDFVQGMRAAGFEYAHGKQPKFRAAGRKNFLKLSRLGAGYSEKEIRAMIAGDTPLPEQKKKSAATPPKKVSMLIDIQEKLQAGKGAGYENWAKSFNLKQMFQTLTFLQENGLADYEILAERATESSTAFNTLAAKQKQLEAAMRDNAALQKHIVSYSKTRDVYAAYRKAGYSKKFLAEHEADILLHKQAKAAFDALDNKKLPSIRSLREDYDKLATEKKKTYAAYRTARTQMQEVLTAKANVDRLLGEQARPDNKSKDTQER